MSYMADISYLLGTGNGIDAVNSTSRKNNTELDMQDFLQLMIVQLQNQTMDDTMDTSEMMNQLVQMQMVTALTNVTEASVMSYASSLVGKTVTIGILNGNVLEEREIEVIGTGVAGGQQVIFGSDGQTYFLKQIMAVGKLPEIEEPDKGEGEGDGEGDNTGGTEGPDGVGPGDGTGGTEGSDGVKPGDGTGENQGTGDGGNTGDSTQQTE